MFGKKSTKKLRKKFFLYSHEYRAEKMGGKKRAKQFFQKHTNSAKKKLWEKNRLLIVRKNVFNIHTNIVTKKWGEKRGEKFIQKHSINARKNVGKIIVGKNCEKRFFIFTRIS